ncbi:hypothetical protein PVAP13_3NG164900 [Panicum virgatum]|uniref:Uncharacterized protein n=1 Tax=Panicum virgatum TaxID=38727 RepID=A0A8T0UDD1_PANVG|nr:hypothetical protein PVAP13_3NG164900 [Panicum virgatum]
MRNKASKTTPVSALSSIKRTFPDASPVSLPSPSPVTFLITTACCCCSSSAVPGGEASSAPFPSLSPARSGWRCSSCPWWPVMLVRPKGANSRWLGRAEQMVLVAGVFPLCPLEIEKGYWYTPLACLLPDPSAANFTVSLD